MSFQKWFQKCMRQSQGKAPSAQCGCQDTLPLVCYFAHICFFHCGQSASLLEWSVIFQLIHFKITTKDAAQKLCYSIISFLVGLVWSRLFAEKEIGSRISQKKGSQFHFSHKTTLRFLCGPGSWTSEVLNENASFSCFQRAICTLCWQRKSHRNFETSLFLWLKLLCVALSAQALRTFKGTEFFIFICLCALFIAKKKEHESRWQTFQVRNVCVLQPFWKTFALSLTIIQGGQIGNPKSFCVGKTQSENVKPIHWWRSVCLGWRNCREASYDAPWCRFRWCTFVLFKWFYLLKTPRYMCWYVTPSVCIWGKKFIFSLERRFSELTTAKTVGLVQNFKGKVFGASGQEQIGLVSARYLYIAVVKLQHIYTRTCLSFPNGKNFSVASSLLFSEHAKLMLDTINPHKVWTPHKLWLRCFCHACCACVWNTCFIRLHEY